MDAKESVAALPCWSGSVKPELLGGGITNVNFTVKDGDRMFVVRVGADIPVHGIMRFNELAASRAAHAIGVSPAVVYAEPGALVLDFIDGKTLTPEDIRAPGMISRIVSLIKAIHYDLPSELEGPSLVFWVFQVFRSYARTLKQGNSRMMAGLPRLMAIADDLEAAVGPVSMVFGHNDLLAANFIDTPDRLWIVDWDYAGFNSPFFDLGNLASNNGFSPEQDIELLEAYFETAATDDLLRRFGAMKCASLLRETMWSMVSEIHSEIDFDYVAYTTENLTRFEKTYDQYKKSFG